MTKPKTAPETSELVNERPACDLRVRYTFGGREAYA